MFKNTLSIKDFSDLSRNNYVIDHVIPAITFPRLPHFLIDDNQTDGNKVSINLKFLLNNQLTQK